MSWQSRGYRDSHKTVAATLSREEHARFTELAKRNGMKPSPFATMAIRKLLKEECQHDAAG